MDYLKDIEQTLNKIPHVYRVQFSLYCAQSWFDNLTDEQKPVIKQALGAVSNWLNGVPTSRADLESAAQAARSAAQAAGAAWSAAYEKQLKEFHDYLHNNIVAKITQLEKQLYGLEL